MTLFRNKVTVPAIFAGIALVIFFPSTGRMFLSDDYCTFFNVSKGKIFVPSFFRPVGDFTLYLNYCLTGWSPIFVYLTNIILHAVNSYLVYLFCMKWFEGDARQAAIAVIAGILFLTYPSHGEAILWAIGRGISLAVTFSLLAMIAFTSDLRQPAKYFLVCACYFIALGSYESTLFLPIILFALTRNETKRETTVWSVLLLVTTFAHLMLRYFVTGGIWRAYNSTIFSKDVISYLDAFLKILLRLFMPPVNHPVVFTICAVILIAATWFWLHTRRKVIEKDVLFVKTMAVIVTGLFATVIIAMLFGVSTRTSDGDRLMYFPSVFFCIFVSLVLAGLIKRQRTLIIAATIILAFQLTFLIINQQHWIKASQYAEKMVNTIKSMPQRPLYVINVPSDYKGAFVFRNCLKEALLHYGIDTSQLNIVNVVRSDELDMTDSLIKPQQQIDNIFVWPSTLLQVHNKKVVAVNGQPIQGADVSSFLFWNRSELVKFE